MPLRFLLIVYFAFGQFEKYLLLTYYMQCMCYSQNIFIYNVPNNQNYVLLMKLIYLHLGNLFDNFSVNYLPELILYKRR